ncbi:MAG: hypothetical protein O3B01_26635 [Planctomycetota bacterium]|nr:hypothetical protein [Planctomycetota bacterium]MDA1142154.1 hypothetical protein [Planctomycetota bacterium]
MDTRAGYLKFAFLAPQKIDLLKLSKIVAGAGYTAKSLQIELKGDIVESGKEKGQHELKLETGQSFPIEGTSAPKAGVIVKGEVQGWDTWMPTLKLLKELGS